MICKTSVSSNDFIPYTNLWYLNKQDLTVISELVVGEKMVNHLTNVCLIFISQIFLSFLTCSYSTGREIQSLEKKAEVNSRAKVHTLFLGNVGLVPSLLLPQVPQRWHTHHFLMWDVTQLTNCQDLGILRWLESTNLHKFLAVIMVRKQAIWVGRLYCQALVKTNMEKVEDGQ